MLIALRLYATGTFQRIIRDLFAVSAFAAYTAVHKVSKGIESVHTSANLIFYFSDKNGKRKYYLSLSYLHISKYSTLFAVHYEKIRIHLREKATNSAKIHSLARKRTLAHKSDPITIFAF